MRSVDARGSPRPRLDSRPIDMSRMLTAIEIRIDDATLQRHPASQELLDFQLVKGAVCCKT